MAGKSGGSKGASGSSGRKPRSRAASPSGGRLNSSERAELEVLLQQVEDMVVAAGGPGVAGRGAGLPTGDGSLGTGRSMMDLQKFRIDWFRLPRRALFEVAAVLAERHWFVRPVTELNIDLFGRGFRFSSEGREFLNGIDPGYPFEWVARDLMREFRVSENVVALWLKGGAGVDGLPEIWIPDCKDVEILPGGKIKVRFHRDPGLSVEEGKKYGKYAEDMRRGRIAEIAPDDEIWRYRYLTKGKRSGGLTAPSLTGILDDLDFIEGAKIGDWNGVWQRRKMVFHVTKGYGISSGGNAGRTVTNAKRLTLEAIAEWLRSLTGAASLATNFDQDFKHIVFPGEFFNAEITKQTWERILMWAGFAGVMLLKSESQIAGVSPYLMLQLRTRVFSERDLWIPFLNSIFGSEDFLGQKPTADLGIAYGNSHLYSVKELADLVSLHATNASMAPQDIREVLLDLSNDRQVRLMHEAHKDRLGYTPAFEPRQGLTPGADESSGGEGGDGAPGPGRPNENAV